ncbi:MAG: tetratricopeptide repeat protein [Prevotellaceae bacterium]|jgi:tetratricopeptide (TPR) repeat protein|nr:tetratricopeptide repeat protein [Prevotellaceae bacterium]
MDKRTNNRFFSLLPLRGLRGFLLFLLLPFWGLGGFSSAFAQAPERHDMRRGNKLYNQGEYNKAEVAYRHGKEKDSTAFGTQFNLADALYKQGKTEEAEKLFRSLTDTDANDARKAQVWHNLGNTQLQQKKYEESVKAYKQSLRLNPNDDETRANLAYAQEMLQKQQQDQPQNQDQQDNQQDQDQQQNQNNEDKQDEQPQQQPQDKQDEQQQQQKISPQDAQRMLEAIQADEKETQDKVNKEKAKALRRQQIEKNW